MLFILTVTITSSHQQIAMGAARPSFPGTDIGKTCGAVYDAIKSLRDKSDKQGGVLSKLDQALLDAGVAYYNANCRPIFGGNPMVGTGSGVTGSDKPVIIDPNVNPSPSTTEESSKPTITKKLPFGLNMPIIKTVPIPPEQAQPSQTAPYKVKVTFTGVTVYNSHEGALSGDGEYDLSAYIHGKLVSLTDMSRKTGASGLWDVSSGETVKFPPGSEITVDIEKDLPLTIFTVGSEVDECGRTSFPGNLQPQIVSTLTNFWVVKDIKTMINVLNPLSGIQDQIDKAINYIGCKLNNNDDIGDIVKGYEPTRYGAGPHFDKSDKGDFALAYTISVTPPPNP
ncbi:MAG TPA: hypothetical protein VIA09_06805 [Nitrososphaeraceae archaeon]|jgi:hypothetical protein